MAQKHIQAARGYYLSLRPSTRLALAVAVVPRGALHLGLPAVEVNLQERVRLRLLRHGGRGRGSPLLRRRSLHQALRNHTAQTRTMEWCDANEARSRLAGQRPGRGLGCSRLRSLLSLLLLLPPLLRLFPLPLLHSLRVQHMRARGGASSETLPKGADEHAALCGACDECLFCAPAAPGGTTSCA